MTFGTWYVGLLTDAAVNHKTDALVHITASLYEEAFEQGYEPTINDFLRFLTGLPSAEAFQEINTRYELDKAG